MIKGTESKLIFAEFCKHWATDKYVSHWNFLYFQELTLYWDFTNTGPGN